MYFFNLASNYHRFTVFTSKYNFLMLGNVDELVTSTLLFNKILNEVSERPKIQDNRQSYPINMVTKIVFVTSSTTLEQLVLPQTCQNKLFLTLMLVFMANNDANSANLGIHGHCSLIFTMPAMENGEVKIKMSTSGIPLLLHSWYLPQGMCEHHYLS